MQTQHRRKLEKLQRLLDEAQSLVTEMLDGEKEISNPDDSRTKFDALAVVEKLTSMDREHAEEFLLERSYRELGAIFVAAGGTRTDSKKPKEWLVNQVLWRIFDFQRGHEAIRTRGSHNT